MPQSRRCVVTPRRMLIVLSAFCALWLFALTHVNDFEKPNSASPRKKPHSRVAQDIDWPPVASLLEKILSRLDQLEMKMDYINQTHGLLVGNSNLTWMRENDETIRKLQQEVIEQLFPARKLNLETHLQSCSYDDAVLGFNYRECKVKIEWMETHWTADPCYAHYGVDGSHCTIAIYLSEVENWCPVLPWRKNRTNNLLAHDHTENATIRTDLKGLMTLFKRDDEGSYQWIKMRIQRLWSTLWLPAAQRLTSQPFMKQRTKRKILVHMGLLTPESGFHIAESAFSGGPLGELVQWSDIITSLYILGHELILSTRVDFLKNILNKEGIKQHTSCPVSGLKSFDLIYLDYVGLKQFRKTAGVSWHQFKCLFRVIDSFGTEPSFNLDSYAKKKRLKSSWGKWGLVPRQYLTMFPHTPDNSFMGFVIENAVHNFSSPVKKDRKKAYIYGKKADMWEGSSKYLSVVNEFFDIHATVFINKTNHEDSYIPAFVTNHGILSGKELQTLLESTKLFIGLGFPYEGPAPLEAIGNGCIFLNPAFDPSKNSKNTQFFKGKPTLRELTSQHPYAEVYIGMPYVYTINTEDRHTLRETLAAIREAPDLKPYLPHEFTSEGMLQRLGAYIQHQDFCQQSDKIWPPLSNLKVKVATHGQSCKDVCISHDLICEPAYFSHLNSETDISRFAKWSGEGEACHTIIAKSEIYAPAYDFKRNCVLQEQALLFSCAGASPEHDRICPCRDFIVGQVALCEGCL